MNATVETTAPLTGRMPVRCMACKVVYQEKPCPQDQDGHESSGLCATCYTTAINNAEADAVRVRFAR